MWTNEQRKRYNLLREREYEGTLTDAERIELAALMQALRDDEAVALAAANARKDQEIAAMATTVEQLEAENRQLREYLAERQAFLARAKSLIADLRAEDQRLRERFTELAPLAGESSPGKRP